MPFALFWRGRRIPPKGSCTEYPSAKTTSGANITMGGTPKGILQFQGLYDNCYDCEFATADIPVMTYAGSTGDEAEFDEHHVRIESYLEPLGMDRREG